ncbi:MAG: PP2C family protein-serine/threonine phosphatase [Chlamydiia bacterium]|nr:PP2C family protein-serine/threonine phosphatase [Chlamydiia bacterium]
MGKKFYPTGSLARRVIFVSLALLVIPLFLHSLFLYRLEFREKYQDVELTLTIIGEAQIALIQERIHGQWDVLDAVSQQSSSLIQQMGIVTMPLPEGASHDFALIDPKSGLFIGKQISQTQALGFQTPFQQLLNTLTHFQNAPYLVSVALLDREGHTLAGEVQSDALSVVLPVRGSNFSISLTVPKEAIRELHFVRYIYRISALVFLIGIVGGFLVWLLTRRIAKPLKNLCHTLERVSEGATHVRYESDSMGFEINELGKQFNQTLDALLQQQAIAEREKLARERLAQEFKIGREIQTSLLPMHFPDQEHLDMAGGFLPATEVGGDYYDVFTTTQEGKILFVIADTAGKGISACLFALGFRSLLRSLVSVKKDLSEALLEANRLFGLDAESSGMFITAWVGLLDPRTHQLTYCSLGHPPALLKQGAEISELSTSAMALGAAEWKHVETQSVSLHSGDVLFLYTDGILEAHNPKQELFGMQRLQTFLLQSMRASSEKLVQDLLHEVELFSGSAPQHDDITCLCVRVKSDFSFEK